MTRARVAAAVAAGVLATAQPHAQAPKLDDLLARLSSYLIDYEQQMSAVVADERYEQAYYHALPLVNWITTKRLLKSEFVFLTVPGDLAWMGFRDTLTVDGKPVPDRDARLQSLVAAGSGDALRQAYQISGSNARFNVGDFPRSINVPTMALGLIHPKNRPRFKVRIAAREKINGRQLTCVEYRESQSPSIVRTRDGASQPAKVTAWIDAADGAVYRTVLDFEGNRADGFVTTKITVNYDRDDRLAMLVPRDMVESYLRPGSSYSSFNIVATAAYTNYRRFQTGGRIVP